MAFKIAALIFAAAYAALAMWMFMVPHETADRFIARIARIFKKKDN